MKSNNQKGSVLGSVLIVVVLVGAVVYYLWSKKDVQAPSEVTQTEQAMQNEQNMEAGQINQPIGSSQNSATTETSLETEISELNTDFSDMNSEDLDM